jgi:competence protein ComEC
MTSRSLGHRAPLLWLVLPFMAGLALGRAGMPGPVGLHLAIAVAGVLLATLACWRAPSLWAPAIAAAMLFAGTASYTLHRARMPAWDVLPPREARLELRIDRVFAQPDPAKASGLATVIAAETHLRELQGQRVYFSLAARDGATMARRSAVVSAAGVLVAVPRDPPGDSFEGYLAGAGINFRLTRGRIVETLRGPSPYQAFCQRAAAVFSQLLGAGVAAKQPELAAVLRAMLLGQKHELSDEHGTLFLRSGTMHLFAISGLHIGVIAVGLHAMVSLLRLPRVIGYVIQTTALWLYVDITGGTPSAVRAFIMVALVQGSLVLRTPGNPLSALAASAGIVVLVWPMQVFSASFQMSYGIVAALLLLGLPLADAWQERWSLFRDRPRPLWRWYHHALAAIHRKTLGAVAIGVASTLVSTLTSVLYFKLFTPAALIANLVLIPAASFVILGGLASLVCGLAGASALSTFFNHSAVMVLWVIDAAVRAVVAFPGTWHRAQFATAWWGIAALTALLAALVFGYRSGWRKERGGWWPPLAIVALALIFGVKFG